MKDLSQLPDNLPVPVDDGACAHLLGASVPSVPLAATSDSAVDLGNMAGAIVAYFYPMIGRPDAPPLVGWNEIPGARGCTPQSCSFRDRHNELQAFGTKLFGVSAQPIEDQREAKERLHLPFELLNDGALVLTNALKLPTFEYRGLTLIKRLTLIIADGMIRKVFYPVFPPNKNVDDVIAWFEQMRPNIPLNTDAPRGGAPVS